jgi:hypothetical protein
MNKTTIVVLLAAVGVLGYLATRGDTEAPSPQPVTLSGCLAPAAQAEFQKRQESPLLFLNEKKEDKAKVLGTCAFDELEVVRDGQRVVMKKTGEDEWEILEPVKSKVATFRVKSMIEAFFTDTALTPARTLKSDALLADFGLGGPRGIEVTVKEGGVVKAALVIGDRKKLEGQGADEGSEKYDTFVSQLEAPLQVYRAKRKDLRQPFDVELSDLRDKKVFSFKAEDLSGVSIVDPTGEQPSSIAVSATWAEDETPTPEGQEPPKEKKKVGTFTLTAPERPDFNLMNMQSYFAAAAGLQANEFIMKAPTEETGLTDVEKAKRVVLNRTEGEPLTIIFGAEKETDKFYAMIAGRDEYMVVSKYTVDNLMKGLDQLRDKNVLGLDSSDDVDTIEIQNTLAKTPLTFAKQKGEWQITSPVVQAPDAKEMKALLSGFKYFRASDFMDVPADLAAVGLAEPKKRVTITANGQSQTIEFGEERDSKVTCRLVDKNLYFTVGSWTAKKFDKVVGDFEDKVVVAVDPQLIQSITLVHKDETVKLERLGVDKWKMTAPEEMDATSGLKDAAANAVANALRSFEVKAFSDKTIEAAGLDAPAFSLRATLSDGTKRIIKVSDTLEDDGYLFSVVTPDRPAIQVFTADKYRVQSIRKKAADLKQ